MAPQETGATSAGTTPVPWSVLVCRWLWKLVAFLAGAVVLGLAVNVASTWLTTSKGSFPPDSPLGALLAQWPLTLLIACCLFLLALLLWAISRWNTGGTAAQAHFQLPTAQDRARMLRRLRFRYEQMLTQSLQGAVQIELGLASRPAAVQQAASLALRLPELPDQPLPTHTSIVEVYEQAQQELLILGAPGAGKSTLLLELAHHLVKQAEADDAQPLPVVLPLSSWATKRPDLQEWLAGQVASLYDVPRRTAQQWVQAGQVLPLLDGLDEMEEAARPACIADINIYHREHLGPLVVCSRAAEYENAARNAQLALHAAVLVQPLSLALVEAYLASLGKPLAELRSALKKNTTLAEIATTPLLLQVLMLTYHDTSVRALSQKEAQLRVQIWTDYIEHMVKRKGDSRRYPLQTTTT